MRTPWYDHRECAGLNLTEVVIWQPGMASDRDPSLILGSQNADSIQGGKGADCILGGGSDDRLRWRPGQ